MIDSNWNLTGASSLCKTSDSILNGQYGKPKLSGVQMMILILHINISLL